MQPFGPLVYKPSSLPIANSMLNAIPGRAFLRGFQRQRRLLGWLSRHPQVPQQAPQLP